jgi:translation initiation factor IF-3
MSNKLHELRLGINIQDHDLNIKLKQARKWLESKEQVRVTVQLKGREKGRPEKALEMLNKIIELISDFGSPTSLPSTSKLIVTFNPKKK